MLEIVEGFVYPDKSVRIDTDAPMAENGYNIAPTQCVNIIYLDTDVDQIVATAGRWWLIPPWFRGPLKDWKATTFNARLEEAPAKNSFRQAWKTGRCLVLATGYYEWTGPKGNKQPHYIRLEQNHDVMLFAGLQSVGQDGGRSCAILTRSALPEIAEIHHRMPVILNSVEADRWLSCADSDEQIQMDYGTHWGNRFQSHRVAKIGQGVDGPELIESIEGWF